VTPSRARLLVSSGEPSGDLYAAELVRHLRGSIPDLDVFGLGGDRMAEQGADLVAHVRDLAVVGLVEVLRHLRRLRGVFRSLLRQVDERRPDLAVLVDYPDFHLRLARELKRRGVPVVYYVSPQLWAWRRGRIRTIRETVAHMIVIFPFEEALYREAGVPATFVGHPLVDTVRPAADREAFLASVGLDPSRPLLLALPGSRPQEVAHNLPPLVDGLRLVSAQRPGVQLALAIAPGLPQSVFAGTLEGLSITPLAGRTHELMSSANAGVVASGTATVEAALLGLPMVVVYRLSALTYALGRPFVRVPHFAMVNLIAGREVVKELIQKDFTGPRVAAEALRLLEGPGALEDVRSGLSDVRQQLGGPGASGRAAQVALRVIDENR
jgi:lipid-A-disaccharide synthase